jgi:RHS repeat-associated protein
LKHFAANGEKVTSDGSLPAGDYFFTGDHLGSVRELVSAGSVQAVYTYDPFGTRSLLSGTLQSDWGFSGLFLHPQSGLQFANFRGFDSRLARWISRDPSGESGGANLYSYVRNSPISMIDPLGLDGVSFGAYFGIGGGLGAKWDSSTGNYAVTVELGFGEGVGGGLTPNDLPPVPQHVYAGITDYSQVSLNGDVGVNVGPVGGNLSLTSKSCDNGSFKTPEFSAGASVGPASFSTKGTTSIKIKPSVTDHAFLSALGLDKLSAGYKGKANMKLDFIRFDPSPLVAPSPVNRGASSSGPAYIQSGKGGQFVPLNQWQNQ